MHLYKVLITAAVAALVPTMAAAQATTASPTSRHECGMMAATEKVPAAAPAMACGHAMATAEGRAAMAPAARPPAWPEPVARSHAGHAMAAGTACCDGAGASEPAASEKPAENGKDACCRGHMAAAEPLTAGKGKEECCCAKTPQS